MDIREVVFLIYFFSTAAAVMLGRHYYGKVTGTLLGMGLGMFLGPASLVAIMLIPWPRRNRRAVATTKSRR